MDSDEFGGIVALQLQGKNQKEEEWDEELLYAEKEPEFEDIILKAVPYAYWNNRGEGEMSVWVKEWH